MAVQSRDNEAEKPSNGSKPSDVSLEGGGRDRGRTIGLSEESRIPADHDLGSNANRHPLLKLQDRHGNQAIQRLVNERIQPKLQIGPPGDKYEREADRMAEAIMRSPIAATVGRMGEGGQSPGVQRMCSRCRKRFRQGRPLDCPDCEEKLQRKESATERPSVGGELARGVQSSRGEGRPLPASVRSFFEPRFGHDFSDVRVHDDAGAAALNDALDAKAFTYGRDIFFGRGQYRPGTRKGTELIAHELVHAAQQSKAASNWIARQVSEEEGFRESEPEEPVESPVEEPYEGRDLLTAASDELQRLISEVSLEYADALVNQDQPWQYFIDLKLELARYKREKFLIDFYRWNPSLWQERGWTAEDVLDIIFQAAETEEQTLALLQQEGIPTRDVLNEILVEMPELFPEYTIGLYQAAEDEFRTLAEDYRAAFDAHLSELTQRPIEEIIPDFVWIMENWSELKDRAALISFFNWLDAEQPVLLERRDPNSTSLALENIRLTLNEYHADWARLLHPDLEEELRFLYPALEDWNFFNLYLRLADQMRVFRLVVEATYERLNVYGSMPDVIADLHRTYSSWAPQVSHEVRREGFRAIAGAMEDVLDAWVADLAWHERIREGFGLYDVLGEIGTLLKELVTPKTIAMMVGFITFLVLIQGVPFANIVVDAILIALGAVALLQGIFIFANYFDRASEATTFRQLYAAAQDLRGAGGAILDLLFTLIGLAASRAIRAYAKYRNRQRIESLAELRNDDIIRRGPPEVREAYRTARSMEAARARIRRVDPENILGPLVDRGVDPRILENALMSGLSPGHISRIAGPVDDVARAQEVIEFAGSYANPIRRMLNEGKDPGIVGRMMDEGFDLVAVDAVSRFQLRTPSSPPAPRNLYHYDDANMVHFLNRHTFEYFDFDQIRAQQGMWPPNTSPQRVADYLQETLEVLESQGRVLQPWEREIVTLPSGVTVQIGVRPDGTNIIIGQFFPVRGRGIRTFTRGEMEVFKRVLQL